MSIEDIVGDINNLIGAQILRSEEKVSSGESDDGYSNQTYTYYTFATVKGWVDIRWYGTSNGYYSERVNFIAKDEWGWDR